MHNDVCLGMIQRYVCLGIIQSTPGMVESVELMAFVRFVPVIEEVIVEQCATYKALSVAFEMQQLNQLQAEISDCQTMEQNRGISML